MDKCMLLLLLLLAREATQEEKLSTQGGLQDSQVAPLDLCAVNTAKILQKLEAMEAKQCQKSSGDDAKKVLTFHDGTNPGEMIEAAIKALSIPTTESPLCFDLDWQSKTESMDLKNLSSGIYFYGQHYRCDRMVQISGDATGHSFKTLDEMRIVLENAPKIRNNYGYQSYWVGATGSSMVDFKWVDGSKVEEQLWHSGQPAVHGAEKKGCASLHIALGYNKLVSTDCTSQLWPLCQVDADCLRTAL